MPRRSWRDLQQRPGGAAPTSPGPASFRNQGGGNDLAQAAGMAPDSRLGELMQQRQALEKRIQGLSGLPGQDRDDPAFNARFNVASFAERRAEEQRWADLRADLQERRDTLNRQANNPAAVDEKNKVIIGDVVKLSQPDTAVKINFPIDRHLLSECGKSKPCQIKVKIAKSGAIRYISNKPESFKAGQKKAEILVSKPS